MDKFRKVLTKKAIESSNRPLVDIYLEETLNFTEASILYPFSNAETTMRKARAKHKPKSKKVVDSDDQQNCLHQKLLKHFSHEILPQNDSKVIIMHHHSLKLLGKVEEIHVDCSISCKTDESELHLAVVLAMVKNQVFAIAFGLLKSKSLEIYSNFFMHVRENFSTFCPNNILTTCDANLQDALKLSFPDATIKIMWFFYASSLLNFAKDTNVIQWMSKSLFHKISIKMMLGIPLIPSSYMIPCFDALKKWMFEKSVYEFNGICEFIDQAWLSTNRAEQISIFNGLSHSINNYVQNFNQDLLSGQSMESLTEEKLMAAINKQAMKTTTKINSKGTSALKKSQKLQLTIFETAKNNWIKANIHLRRPIQFLQQVSHCFDDDILNFLLNYDVGNKKIEIETFILPRPDTAFSDMSSVPSPAPSMTSLSEPPPLIFFNQKVVKSIQFPSEPPPLVPITRQTSTIVKPVEKL